jgi:hypothetical protein
MCAPSLEGFKRGLEANATLDQKVYGMLSIKLQRRSAFRENMKSTDKERTED